MVFNVDSDFSNELKKKNDNFDVYVCVCVFAWYYYLSHTHILLNSIRCSIEYPNKPQKNEEKKFLLSFLNMNDIYTNTQHSDDGFYR